MKKKPKKMTQTARFGISMDESLLERFDSLILAKGYGSRSEAIRDLIRGSFVEEQWHDDDEEIVATVTLVYDHHTRELSDKLTDHQHSHHQEILSSLHVHLDAHHCLEVIVLKGTCRTIRRLADELISTKGIQHGTLVTTTTGNL